METPDLEQQIITRGKTFFKSIEEETPSLFNKSQWVGKVLDWAMQNEDFKVNLFRFVDVFPYLESSSSLTRHIQEYFADDDKEIPSILKWGAKSAGFGGMIGGKILNTVISHNIKSMAKQFIVGEKTKDAVKNLSKLRNDGFTFTVDVLGEATVSETEADLYLNTYLDLLDTLGKEQKNWKAVGSDSDLDWGFSPKIQVSVKPTGLYSDVKPEDLNGSVDRIMKRLQIVYNKIIQIGGSMCIDMEAYKYKNITLEVYKRLRSHPDYRHYKHLAIAMQAYLTDTDQDMADLIHWARKENLPIEVRLVKGAYWDYETVYAEQQNWPSPVWMHKSETDMAFERISKLILKNHDICYFACGSHNIRSISNVMEWAQHLNVPESRYEFQVLFGMAEPVRKGLKNIAKRVRLYAPYGEMIPGMAYLVRRLLENTANESFLRQSFVEESDMADLLKDPSKNLPLEKAHAQTKAQKRNPNPFINEPLANFWKNKDEADKFRTATIQVRSQLGKKYPLFINGKDILKDRLYDDINPNNTSEVLGKISIADTTDVDNAIAAAKSAFQSWKLKTPHERAQYLIKAAQIARNRIYELSAWQILEGGKQWDQAHGDVCEAIDFLEYYAREMIRLSTPTRLGDLPGEVNLHSYEPKGVSIVIAPWNFPLAISLGMVSAAIVTGNTVVYKPAEPTPIVGFNIVEIFKEAGIPAGVFNYLSGYGREIGDHLVDHPDVSLIAFTGSMDIGLRIYERASKVHPGQTHLKKVICEMGGKNAIIVDDDADLDEVIAGVLYSAFGYQGQKCSACSRLIVLDEIYDRLVTRLAQAAESWHIGSPEDPQKHMGAVISEKAQKTILDYQAIASQEGNVIYKSKSIPTDGFFVPILIVDGITPQHRIAQEEVFGPVLAIMRAKDMDQALLYANSTKFALTGALYSRSPKHIQRAKKEFRVGNLYINRGSTGAMVGRQAFGGSYMSGGGTKAGGPDYLLHFMDPKVSTENTMRRGFTPADE